MKTNKQKQVAAFDQVLGLCNNLGENYKPVSDSINLAALNSLIVSARESVNAVHIAKLNFTDAVNARQAGFAVLPGMGTRILNLLIASDASPQLIADVRAYRNKLRPPHSGRTVKPEDGTNTAKPASASRGPISYLDYESKVVNFRSIVDLVAGEPRYNVNEPAFTIEKLNMLISDLVQLNARANAAQSAYRNARRASNITLYGDEGLYGATKRVKKYVLFAFGATSEQYRTINSVILKAK